LQKFLNMCVIRRLVVLSSLSIIAASASAQLSEQALRDFTACDASFFQRLATETRTTEALPALQRKDNVAWIKVPDRSNDKKNQLQFNPPVRVAELNFSGYFDESSDLDMAGKFYSWGFIVEGSLNDVANKLKPYIKNVERLRRGKEEYARTEIKVGESWLPINLPSGTVPMPLTVERVFILETVDEKKTAVRVTCSLQGAVTGDMLKQERPDIEPADYPVGRTPATAADSVLRPEVLKKIDAAAPAGSVWRPRFSKVRFTEAHNGDKPFTLKREIEARDGLLYTREIYSPTFHVDRVSLADLVQIRAKMNGIGPGRFFMTTAIDIALPQALTPGATLAVDFQGQNMPAARTETPSTTKFTCTVTQSIAAKSIHASLTGTAVLLSCEYPDASDAREYALLEDLGLVVQTKSKSKQYGESEIHYSHFEVTKDGEQEKPTEKVAKDEHARIRLFGQAAVDLSFYPDAACYGGKRVKVSGSGFGGLFGSKKNISLGMPETPNVTNLKERDGNLFAKAFYREYSVAAGKPLTVVGSSFESTGRTSISCGEVGGYFVPEDGKDYDVVFNHYSGTCKVVVTEIDATAAPVKVWPVGLSPLLKCTKGNTSAP
jgi:hypothetical protein